MNFIDTFSIVSGVASITSLLLSLRERFASWRRYALPLSYALGGFAAGRISALVFSPGTSTPSGGWSSGVLILSIVVLAIISIATFALLKKNEPGLAYLVLLLGLSSAAPQVIRSFSESSTGVPVGDLLLLAAQKERVGDYSGAIGYFHKAVSATEDRDIKERLRAKIAVLQTNLYQSMTPSLQVSPSNP